MEVDIDNLEAILKRMESDGLVLKSPLKWGFFFVDPNKENLMKVFAELSDHSYSIQELHETDDGMWVLQVSKTEILPLDKLHRRNIAFHALAEHCGVSLYDGWDVGRVEANPAFERDAVKARRPSTLR